MVAMAMGMISVKGKVAMVASVTRGIVGEMAQKERGMGKTI